MANPTSCGSNDCEETIKDNDSRPILSIVVPAYNEAWSLPQAIAALEEVGCVLDPNFEIIVCNDGSTDQTLPVLRYLQSDHPHLRVLSNERNAGIAISLRRLYNASRGQWVAFWPADQQIAPSELRKMWQARERDIVIGRRTPRQDHWFRLFMSHGLNWLVRIIWGLKVYDVDSVVLYNRTVLQNELRSEDLCLPIEILYKAARHGFTYCEVPIDHLPRRGGKASGVRLSVAVRTIFHLLTARILRTWDLPHTNA